MKKFIPIVVLLMIALLEIFGYGITVSTQPAYAVAEISGSASFYCKSEKTVNAAWFDNEGNEVTDGVIGYSENGVFCTSLTIDKVSQRILKTNVFVFLPTA